MKKFRLINCYTAFLTASFLLFSVLVQAVDRDTAYISSSELYEVLANSDMKYVYLGKEFSDLYEVVSRINRLEDNEDSVTSELQKHIEDGFSIGLYDSVLEALSYAERVLEKNSAKISAQETQEIAQSLEVVINQMVNEVLNIDAKEITDLAEINIPFDGSEPDTRCGGNAPMCCYPTNNCKVIKVRDKLDVFENARFRKNVEIDGKLKVYGKSTFKEDVTFKDDVCFEDEVCFKDNVKFKDEVEF